MTPKAKKNTEKLYVFLPEDVHEAIKKEADQKGTTVSGLIRMLVMEHLNKKK